MIKWWFIIIFQFCILFTVISLSFLCRLNMSCFLLEASSFGINFAATKIFLLCSLLVPALFQRIQDFLHYLSMIFLVVSHVSIFIFIVWFWQKVVVWGDVGTLIDFCRLIASWNRLLTIILLQIPWISDFTKTIFKLCAGILHIRSGPASLYHWLTDIS